MKYCYGKAKDCKKKLVDILENYLNPGTNLGMIWDEKKAFMRRYFINIIFYLKRRAKRKGRLFWMRQKEKN